MKARQQLLVMDREQRAQTQQLMPLLQVLDRTHTQKVMDSSRSRCRVDTPVMGSRV